MKAQMPSKSQNKLKRSHTLHCIDLFAGCGGLSLGLEQAGFHPLLFSEINKDAAETYRANRPDLDIVEVGDIRELTDSKLRSLKTKWEKSGVDDVDLASTGELLHVGG